MNALKPETFLKALDERREAAWTRMTADRKSYGAEKPLTRAVILRRLQFGVVMERRAGEVTARWVNQVPDLDIQRPLSDYVANELKHAAILRERIKELDGDPDALWSAPLPELKELWDYHASLGSFCELLASVQYGHGEFFPRTSKSFIERVEPIDPKTAAIYRDTLLGDEEGRVAGARGAEALRPGRRNAREMSQSAGARLRSLRPRDSKLQPSQSFLNGGPIENRELFFPAVSASALFSFRR